MRKKLEKLLSNSETSYAIAKGSGVPCSTISDLRSGKRTLDLLSLVNAEKLLTYIEKTEPKKINYYEALEDNCYKLTYTESLDLVYTLCYITSAREFSIFEAVDLLCTGDIHEFMLKYHGVDDFDYSNLEIVEI